MPEVSCPNCSQRLNNPANKQKSCNEMSQVSLIGRHSIIAVFRLLEALAPSTCHS
jgi:hypothetical protein